jgi:type 1 glutamine amidotransferase
MCMSHFACGAFQEWPEFIGLAGRVWNGQGHDKRGPFTVRVVDKTHPVTAGLQDFETDDELYFCLKGDADIHLLCDAHSKKRKADHPQAFVFQPGKGRAFLCTLGHDTKAFEARSVQQLYRQAAAWATGLN